MKKCMAIDIESGEVILDEFTIYEEEDMRNRKKQMEIRKSKEDFKMYVDRECGSFYFLFYKLINKGIDRQYITRFIYLSTFMDYNNNLTYGNGKEEARYMNESDLMEVLKLSKTETFRTKKVFIENELILIDENSKLSINIKYCLKGKIEGNKNKSHKVRIFEQGIREIYERSLPREHKKIALLFEILPYVNFKYNIICTNINCEMLQEINALTIKDICKLINYSENQSSRLKKELLSLKVNNEFVCLLEMTGVSETITINPKVYYKGGELEDLQYVIGRFKIKNK